MSGTLRLYGYWRSSAAYRVRIALNLKGLATNPCPCIWCAMAASNAARSSWRSIRKA